MPGAGDRLLVFTRMPVPGRTKTRLIPALGAERAAALHAAMVEHVLARVRRWRGTRGQVEVRFTGGRSEDARRAFGEDLAYADQGTGDLGARLRRGFEEAFGAGARRVVVIGTDCPGLNEGHVRRAFARLRRTDVVLGPARDGGYTLLGLRRPAPGLFGEIPWGSGGVLEATLSRARSASLCVSLLETLDDVDRPEDLAVWRRANPVAGRASISVVVPALNEARRIGSTLARAAEGVAVELLVVDGGSADSTRNVAEASGARVLRARSGRAAQMNVGAAAATGDVLLFLHSDTLLPADYDEAIRNALTDPEVRGGAFRLRVDSPRSVYRFMERTVAWRSRWLRRPYGDQALFCWADVFRDVGGYPDWPILEDVDLVRRMRRGGRLALLSDPVVSSARFWETRGFWRATWINQKILWGRRLGAGLPRLARWRREA